jgi:uncharacterized membrane protein
VPLTGSRDLTLAAKALQRAAGAPSGKGRTVNAWEKIVGVVVVVVVSAAICLWIARRHGDRRAVWAFFGLTGVIGIVLTLILIRTPGARRRARP